MKTPEDTLENQLRIIRNLTASSYGSLLNGGALKSELSNETLLQNINSLIYRIRKRYDSYKTLVQTLPSGAKSEGALALADSILSHTEMLNQALLESALPELSKPYLELCEPLLAQFLTSSPPSRELIRESLRLSSHLKTHMPDALAFYFCVQAAYNFSRKLSLNAQDGLAKIVREITFPPEYQQAGLSILSYFSTVLQDKYPDVPATISIQQHPDVVTLIITLPDGTQDRVSKTLNEYGLVVTGKISPREFIDDDIRALALQQKLELAHMEVRQTRELLKVQDSYATKRIESLEVEIRNLHLLLSREFTSRENLQSGLLDLASRLAAGHISEQTSSLLQNLATAITERNGDKARVVLEDIQSSQPGLFSKLNEFFLQAATSGVIGNSVYDWLKLFWPALPK
jgi:hypothetical protein